LAVGGRATVAGRPLADLRPPKLVATKRRFVPIKSIEQQAILSVHRVRQGFVKARTAQANQIRGLLGEFGLIIPQGIYNAAKRVPELLEDASNELPVPFRHLINRLTEHLKELDRQVKEFEAGDYRLAPQWRAQPQAGEDPRHWPAGRERTGRIDRGLRTALTTAGRSPRGWAWFRVKAPAAASQRCSG
jgi:transposase